MTAHPLKTPKSGLRLQAIEAIIRKDMALLGPFAVGGALALFIVSALVHAEGDIPALAINFGSSTEPSTLSVGAVLFGLCAIVLPVAMSIFVILLAQTDVATDTRRDWLVRPIAPLEIVAAKAVVICAVIIAPMIAGDLIYMLTKPPVEDLFETLWAGITCSIFLLVLSWLVSTPFQAVLAVFGIAFLLSGVVASGLAVKIALSYALMAGGSSADSTPFPGMADSWIVSLGALVGLVAVSGVTLRLLLVQRRRIAARWLFAGYFAISMFLNFVLFVPFPAEKPEATGLHSHTASATEAAMTRLP